MQKSVLLRALQQEIRRHNFNYFVHEPPSIRARWERSRRTLGRTDERIRVVRNPIDLGMSVPRRGLHMLCDNLLCLR